MSTSSRRLAACAVGFGLLAAAGCVEAATKELVVLTSFRKELFEAYKQAFR